MVRGLVFVIHQGHRSNSQSGGSRDLRVRIVTEREIKSAITRPFARRRSAPDQVAGFTCDRSPAMTPDYVGHHSLLCSQLYRLCKVAFADLNCVTPGGELRNQCMEKKYVRRISQIDPDVHLR